MNAGREDRLLELLTTHAVEGLSPVEQSELDQLQARSPGVDSESVAQAAAALHLALAPAEDLPAALRGRLVADADRFFSHTRHSSESATPIHSLEATAPRSFAGLAWLAVAATLLLAVAGWLPRLVSEAETDLGTARAELLADAGDLIQVSWSATDDPAAVGASGDVVWSPAQQTGYMRFAGLEANDPAVQQYQLWIFDADRDERFPVDGGVFDIPDDGGEVIVPIRAKIAVSEATLFAVTVEKPGGVVVSDRERIVVTAQPG